METDVVELFKRACQLPEKDRAELAGLLLASLETEPDPAVEQAWATEIDRRVAELDAGTVKTVPWETVKASCSVASVNPDVEFHPAAEQELLDAEDWYAARSLVAARAFVQEVGVVIERALEAPERWPTHVRGTRRIVFPRFPFSLIYRLREERVQVVGNRAAKPIPPSCQTGTKA